MDKFLKKSTQSDAFQSQMKQFLVEYLARLHGETVLDYVEKYGVDSAISTPELNYLLRRDFEVDSNDMRYCSEALLRSFVFRQVTDKSFNEKYKKYFLRLDYRRRLNSFKMWLNEWLIR